MASFTLTGFSSTARTLTASEFGIVTKDAELVVTTGDAITADGSHFLTLNGTVLAHSSSSFSALDFDGSSAHVFIGPDGFVSSANADTLSINATSTVRIQNAGTIMSGSDAVDVRQTDGAINLSMTNTGTIMGESDGVNLDAGSGFTRFVNTGTITGQEGYGIWMNWQSGSTGGTLLRNTGTITGDNGSFNASSGTGVNTIVNDGVMNGAIYFQGGNDVYEGGGGKVSGTVFGGNDNDRLAGGAFSDDFDGGSGNDTLIGRGGDDSLDGGSGNDLLVGNDGDDYADGGAGSDTVKGGAGEDELFGGTENDTVTGGANDDFLDGGSGLDVLDGGAGSDTMIGGLGDDLIRGRDGADFLTGGQGLDILTGGSDADVFVYEALADSTANANRDVILDFELGVDEINLGQVVGPALTFRGTAGFTATGVGELRLQETAAGSTIVRIDADGNGTTDMEINVAQVQGLTADDFVL